MAKRENRNLFEEIMQGLKSMKDHREGKIKLKTTIVEVKMNKQPFYHGVDISLNGVSEKTIIETVKKCKSVLKDTVQYNSGELLFTATNDVSYEVSEKLKKLGVKLESDIDAEPGDPADLL